jgi:hypothetical protein
MREEKRTEQKSWECGLCMEGNYFVVDGYQ